METVWRWFGLVLGLKMEGENKCGCKLILLRLQKTQKLLSLKITSKPYCCGYLETFSQATDASSEKLFEVIPQHIGNSGEQGGKNVFLMACFLSHVLQICFSKNILNIAFD